MNFTHVSVCITTTITRIKNICITPQNSPMLSFKSHCSLCWIKPSSDSYKSPFLGDFSKLFYMKPLVAFSILPCTFSYSCLQVSRNFPVTKYSTGTFKKISLNSRCHIILVLYRKTITTTKVFTCTHTHTVDGKRNTDKASSLCHVHTVYSLAEGPKHCKKSIKVSFILCFISRAIFPIQRFYMTFVFENLQKSLLLAGMFPLVWFPSRFTDQFQTNSFSEIR